MGQPACSLVSLRLHGLYGQPLYSGPAKRSTDAYTPGGGAGFRPIIATTTLHQDLKELYPDVPVLIGGIENPCEG